MAGPGSAVADLARLAGLALVFACSEPATEDEAIPVASEPAPWFEEMTAEAGLDFVHDAGLDGSYFMPEILGAGGALFDADGDGRLDLYLVSGGPHGGAEAIPEAVNRLLLQRSDGTFEDVTERSGGGDPGYGMGCAVGDVDNDGDLDLYVTNFGADALYLNSGVGASGAPVFVDVTEAAGISAPGWSTSAGFFDVDGDGHLDLYVTRYVDYDRERRCTTLAGQPEYCGPQAFRGLHDLLFRNLGEGPSGAPRFADVSREAGLAGVAGRGLGVSFADFDGDGRPDVFVANDGEKNQLWIQRGSGSAIRFEDRAVVRGVAVNLLGRVEASMGVALGDADNDGDLDLFMTHLDQETNTLYLNADQRGFEDRVAGSGLGAASLAYTGFGTDFFDGDLDGDLDLLVVNGKVRLEAGAEQNVGAPAAAAGEAVDAEAMRGRLRDYAERNLLFENAGGGVFRDRGSAAGWLTGEAEVSRGAVFGDLDLDGDLDLLLTNAAGPARLFRNVAPRRGRFLSVRAFDPALGRDAVGALIRLEAAGRSWLRPVTHTAGYLTSKDAAAHFGLGDVEQVERAVVVWPGGREEAFGPLAVDRAVVLRRGEGEAL